MSNPANHHHSTLADELNSFHGWAALLVQGGAVEIAAAGKPDIAVNSYEDTKGHRYIVIDIYRSDTESDQYLFFTEDATYPEWAMMELLRMVDFRLDRLLDLVEHLNYEPTLSGNSKTIGDVCITHVREKQVQP